MKDFYVKWEWRLWMSDPALSMCDPSTRGIWMDALCAMMESGSDRISGTLAQLSRICRCTETDMERAIADLKQSKTCEIVKQNESNTLICRRLSKKLKISKVRASVGKQGGSKPKAKSKLTLKQNESKPLTINMTMNPDYDSVSASPEEGGVGEEGPPVKPTNGNGQHNPCIQEPEDAPDKKAGDVPPDDDAHCNPPVAEPDKKKPNTQLLALEAMRCYEGNPTQPARSVVTHIQELLNSGYTVEQMRLVFGAIMRGQIEWPPRTAFAMTEPGRFGGLLTLAMQAQNGAGAPLTPQEKAERAAWKRRVEKERAERKQEQAELAKRTPEEKEWRKSIKLCPKI